ncbi:uncharacterized protein LOC111340602 [Stylophora pistillata]|nr:uncharacterized protein LOC111340602 [Stylophora pistillata]XP_022803210.1 uncharacterized protein LOC111340602 [Stylophora pistillata]XP_022803211.1 uncharacterized protein LOC111340602 [Stylophora pistillata]
MCGLKDSRRKRRSSHNVLYDYKKVHLLPGYPKNSSDPLRVAFYVLQPAFLFIGNCTALPRDALVAIMKAHKLDIEKVIGANISGIEALFKPTTTTESPTGGPAEPADDSWKWIVIGVVIGVVVIILIGLLIFCLRKRKRDVKPITDPSQEDIAVQEGAKKENSLGIGSHSA